MVPAVVFQRSERRLVPPVSVFTAQKVNGQGDIGGEGFPSAQGGVFSGRFADGGRPVPVAVQRRADMPRPGGPERCLQGNHHILPHVPGGRDDAVQKGTADQAADQIPGSPVTKEGFHERAVAVHVLPAILPFFKEVAGNDVQVLRHGFFPEETVGVGLDGVVTVAVDDIIAGGKGKGLHAHGGLPAVAAHPESLHLGAPGREIGQDVFQNLHGAVRGAVVDEDIFDVGEGLREQRAGAAAHIGLYVIDRYDDADGWHLTLFPADGLSLSASTP